MNPDVEEKLELVLTEISTCLGCVVQALQELDGRLKNLERRNLVKRALNAAPRVVDPSSPESTDKPEVAASDKERQ